MACGDQDERPIASVVVASFCGGALLTRCLDSILAQDAHVEVIVASNACNDALADFEARYPAVQYVRGSAEADVFQLRSLGVRRARGKLIVLTEDHCTVSPSWIKALLAAHQDGHAIVGGPVDNGLERRAYDWALYFSEYGIYMPPQVEGASSALSGVNVAYDRELLMSCRPTWEHAFHENEVHDVLGVGGRRLYSTSEAWVKSHLPMTLREAMAHLSGGGRHFGLYRRMQSSPARRALWILASPAVPFVLLGRIALRVWRRNPRRLLHLARSMPYLLCLLGAWSAGEARGHLGFNDKDRAGMLNTTRDEG